MTTSTFIPVSDAGIGASASAGASSNAGGDLGIGGTSVLALTGAGPGTLLLALTGLASLIAGGVAMLTGRRLLTSSNPDSPLRDLSHRVGELT